MPNYKRVRTVRRYDAEAGISLLKRRRWFAGDDADADGGDPQDENGRDAQEDPGRDAQDPNADEVARLQGQIADLQQRLSDVNSEAARRRKEKDKALEDAGQWETLAKERADEIARLQDELGRIKPKYDALIESIDERNDARVKQIPEGKRSLVPTGYSPETLATWLDANWGQLTTRAVPDIDAGAGGGGGKGKAPALTAEQKETADAFGMTPEEYAKQLDELES